mgnify:CR=1 FL=1
MKFNRLRLTNIGAFYGNYDFNLKSDSGSGGNIVLLGGKNGSGKTTILESIRLALYGPLAYGYKTESAPYFEKVFSKLNSNAIKNRESKYQIIIDFEMVENFEKNVYTLRRSWVHTKATIKEELDIQRNYRQLSVQEKEFFTNKLREEMPPQLLEFFLFDGERISQIISDDTLSGYLKESARVMFNIDLFETLELDLLSFMKHEGVSSKLTNDEKELLASEEKINGLLNQRKSLLDENNEIEREIDEQLASLKQLEREYDIQGGLRKGQREQLLRDMNRIEEYRGGLMGKNKELISTIMPFCLIRDLLHEVVTQIEQESKHEVIENLSQVLHAELFFKTIEGLEQNQYLTLHSSKEDVSKMLLQSLFRSIEMENRNTLYIHKASVQQRTEVKRLYEDTLRFDPDLVRNNLLENEKLIEEVREIRNRISASDSTEELKDIMEEINRTQNKISTLEHRKEQLKVSLTTLEEQILTEKKRCEDLRSKLIQLRKQENVFTIVSRVIEVSRKFKSLQMKKKLQQVEIETTKMLQRLFRKELFVTRVFIHPETFVMKLFNSNNEEINKDILSAGEKQILLMSTIWAMTNCSKRKLPFVFDTLLGRLDQTHKKSIIEHYLPRCGEQILILSTDSEIDQEFYKLIKPLVARTYTIEFNTSKSLIEVSDTYFNFPYDKRGLQ